MNNYDICIVMDIFKDRKELEVYSPILDKTFNITVGSELITDLLEDENVGVEVDLDKKVLVN